MGVGTQLNSGQMDALLTQYAVQARNLLETITNLYTTVQSSGGLSYLESIGYSNEPNDANPGSQSDAAWALQVLEYMSLVAGVAGGTVQAGGTGGTGATTFDYVTALAPLWAGQ